LFPTYNKFFTIPLQPRHESTYTADHSIHDPSYSLKIDHSITLEVDHHKLVSGKTKFENYIRAQDVNLGVIFAVLDTDSSQQIDFGEFKRKLKALHMNLDDDEMASIFKSMDINGSNSITYNELVEMFASINTQ
jgi:Ca2+-binding EF-hand superfamily protein